MTPGPALLLLLLGAVSEPEHLRYERPITSGQASLACAPLDPDVFAHAAPSLKDLRIFAASGRELPYAVTISGAAQPEGETAHLLHLVPMRGGVEFDLEMPARPYTQVKLILNGRDYVATAHVTGNNKPGAMGSVDLGSFPVFDLSARHLSHSTTISLQESTFHLLHIVLRGPRIGPAMVEGAEVPPSREAQTVFLPVARSGDLIRRGTTTVATFQLPARVPVERVSITPAPGFRGNFSRAVRLTAHTAGLTEAIDGSILRVHLGGIDTTQLNFPASVGSNLQEAASVEVAVEDGLEAPLPIAAVTLEMRERRICFRNTEAPAALFYGDPGLLAPVYPASRIFASQQPPAAARLGPEIENPGYRPRSDRRSFSERYPDFGWLLAVILASVLGTFALRHLRHRGSHPRRP